MLNQPTIDKLAELRLGGMAEAYERQRQDAAVIELSFDERFSLLVESEWLYQKNRALQRRIKYARFRQKATLEDINYLDGAILWPDQQGGRRVDEGIALISMSSNVAFNLSMQRRGLPIAYLMQKLGRMVAHLLQLHQHTEDNPLALNPLQRFYRFD